MQTKKDFSCGGVVWDETNRKLLLIQVENLSRKIVWTFPKGHPEEGETDEQAALREVREETGWDCEVVKPLTDVHYFYTRDGVRTSKTVRWFLMKPVKQVGECHPVEVIQCMWVPVSEVPLQLSYETDIKLLEKLSPLFL